MKKRLISFMAMLLCSLAVLAQKFEADGINYNVTSTTAPLTVEVTYNYSKSGEIVIPNTVEYNNEEYSVTSIGNNAFFNCSGLTAITIPISVTSIGYNAFKGCDGLTSIVVEAGNTVLDSRNNCNAIIKTETNELIVGCKNTVIPNSVTSIGSGAFFNCSGLTSIDIPNSVTSIGNCAFAGCSGLTSIDIPSSVTSIGQEAFWDCNGLTAIVVEAGNTVYDSRNNCNAIIKMATNELIVGCKNTVIPNSVTSIGDGAFYNCSGLTSISIPNTVTTIGSYAFHDCSGLTAITILNSVTSIGDYAFSGCSGLTSISIPNSVTSIGSYAFWGCSSLTAITIPSSVTSIEVDTFWDCSGLTSVTIPNSVTSIGNYAFYNCSGLTSITIPSSVTSIGDVAFCYCSGLTSIVVEAGNTVYDSRNNCNAIIKTETNELIVGCMNTVIPNSVTRIGSSAFLYCSGLTSITIPNSVTSIGDGAFYDCSGLTSITIPNSVTSIGDGAFNGCIGLTSITIPNSVTSIGDWAFAGCSGLTSITIPNSVTSIGDWAFSYCSGLTSFTVGAKTPIAIHESCFPNRENATLYVPKGSKAAYEAADYWKEFKEIIELGPEPISITMATSSGTAREMKGYSCAYGLDFNGIEDVKAYIAVGFSKDHTVYLSRVRVVPPNTGIVLKTTKPGITVEVPTTDEDAYWVNMLLPALNNVTVNPTETVDNVEYRNLMVGMITATNKMGFVEFSSPIVRSNNCYLRVPASFYNSSASARMRRALDMVFDDDGTTDIRSIEDHYIVEQESSDDNQVYDLQGRKVTTPRNGLVIKNGKLIFVKP